MNQSYIIFYFFIIAMCVVVAAELIEVAQGNEENNDVARRSPQWDECDDSCGYDPNKYCLKLDGGDKLCDDCRTYCLKESISYFQAYCDLHCQEYLKTFTTKPPPSTPAPTPDTIIDLSAAKTGKDQNKKAIIGGCIGGFVIIIVIVALVVVLKKNYGTHHPVQNTEAHDPTDV